MQVLSVTPSTIIDVMFILGLVLMIIYALEFVYYKSSKRQSKRVFNVIVSTWFILLGVYVFFALSYWIGILVVIIGVFQFYWDRRIAGKLLLAMLLCAVASAPWGISIRSDAKNQATSNLFQISDCL